MTLRAIKAFKSLALNLDNTFFLNEQRPLNFPSSAHLIKTIQLLTQMYKMPKLPISQTYNHEHVRGLLRR